VKPALRSFDWSLAGSLKMDDSLFTIAKYVPKIIRDVEYFFMAGFKCFFVNKPIEENETGKLLIKKSGSDQKSEPVLKNKVRI
jgi:hypothetical protein